MICFLFFIHVRFKTKYKQIDICFWSNVYVVSSYSSELFMKTSNVSWRLVRSVLGGGEQARSAADEDLAAPENGHNNANAD